VPHYVYAIIEDAHPPELPVEGIAQAPVRLAGNGRLAAVVSELPPGRLRPRRRNLKAHQDVLTAVQERCGTPLPFAFGTVVPDEGELTAILERFGEAFQAQLARVQGRREHTFKLGWDVPDVFAHVVSLEPQLAALRDATFAGGEPSQDALIDLGRAFEAARGHLRDAALERAREALLPVTAEIRVNPPKGDGDLVDLALLVPEGRREALDAAVATLAATFDDTHVIQVTGPWAPYSFVDLQIS
jgi:hypothetical protein